MNRREVLTGGAAVLATGAASTAVAAVPAPAENPALIALADELPRIEAAYHEAVAAWDAMWREWSPKWPLAPEPCISNHGEWYTEIERDLFGTGLVRHGRDRPLWVQSLAEMESRRGRLLDALARDAKRKSRAAQKTLALWQSEIARLERGIALLPGYLAECERIKRASNVDAITKARRAAANRMFSFARQVLSEPSNTIEGVRIKAQAVAALGRLARYDVVWGKWEDSATGGDHIGALLGKAVLEVI